MLTAIFSKSVSAVVRLLLNCSKAQPIRSTTCSSSCMVNLAAMGSTMRSANFVISACMLNPALVTLLPSGVTTMPSAVLRRLTPLSRRRVNSSNNDRRVLNTFAAVNMRRGVLALAELSAIFGPDRSGGDGCGLTVGQLGDDLEPHGEFHTENQFWQLVVAVEAAPTFLRGFDEL